MDPRPIWQKDAHCVDTDPESWFDPDPETHVVLAKVCAGCPVREQCFEQAVETDEIWAFRAGIWLGPELGETDAGYFRRVRSLPEDDTTEYPLAA